jgi:glycosyltransferase involved in cell wall biosynthesis
MSTKTAVCHVAAMDNWGGVERMLVDVLTCVKSQSLQHLLMCTSSKPDIVEPIISQSIPFFQPDCFSRYDPRIIVQMSKWLREHNVQLVHSYNAYANLWGCMASSLSGTPTFISGERGSVWWAQPPVAWLDRWAQHKAKVIIANSNASSRMLQLRYNMPPEKIQVIYNAIPAPPIVDKEKIRTELGIGRKQLVGSVGRLDSPKDYFTFVEAASIVVHKRNDVRFLIIGGGPMHAELQDTIAAYGLQNQCILAGWREDARSLMQALDVFVSTSIREAFGNALVEAALARIPIIAPCVDGIPEAVIDGRTGLLLKPTRPMRLPRSTGITPIPKAVLINGELQPPRSLNPNELAETILHLLDRSELRLKLGQAGKERAERLFSLDRYSSRLEGIYLKAIQSRS